MWVTFSIVKIKKLRLGFSRKRKCNLGKYLKWIALNKHLKKPLSNNSTLFKLKKKILQSWFVKLRWPLNCTSSRINNDAIYMFQNIKKWNVSNEKFYLIYPIFIEPPFIDCHVRFTTVPSTTMSKHEEDIIVFLTSIKLNSTLSY